MYKKGAGYFVYHYCVEALDCPPLYNNKQTHTKKYINLQHDAVEYITWMWAFLLIIHNDRIVLTPTHDISSSTPFFVCPSEARRAAPAELCKDKEFIPHAKHHIAFLYKSKYIPVHLHLPQA